MVHRKYYNIYGKVIANLLVRNPYGNYSLINDTLPSDVFIAGYPKSGNTWLQSMLCAVVLDSNPVFQSDSLVKEVIPDIHMNHFYKRLGEVQFFKTHLLPKPRYKKAIHLVRDGRDALLSFFHMQKSESIKKKTSLERLFNNEPFMFPFNWATHCSTWIENPHDAEILIVRFEDLKKDPIKELKRISAFAGIERSERTYSSAVAGNSLQMMKNKEDKFGSDNKMQPENFFRKGKEGAYLEEVPDHLVELFTLKNDKILNKLGYIN